MLSMLFANVLVNIVPDGVSLLNLVAKYTLIVQVISLVLGKELLHLGVRPLGPSHNKSPKPTTVH